MAGKGVDIKLMACSIVPISMYIGIMRWFLWFKSEIICQIRLMYSKKYRSAYEYTATVETFSHLDSARILAKWLWTLRKRQVGHPRLRNRPKSFDREVFFVISVPGKGSIWFDFLCTTTFSEFTTNRARRFNVPDAMLCGFLEIEYYVRVTVFFVLS